MYGLECGDKMSDTINRQDAIDVLIRESTRDGAYGYIDAKSAVKIMRQLPSAEQNHRICRNCKEAKFYGNVDKNGNVECMWFCENWDGVTDEEGFCHEWESR